MEIIVTLCDEAAHLTVEGVADCDLGVAAVTVCGKFWGLYAIAQKEDVTPFLYPQIHPIYCGLLHCQICPGLCRSSQST